MEKFYATGRRKTSVARVWVIPGGTGKITVNHKPADQYFDGIRIQAINEPFGALGGEGTYDVMATVKGGGVTGQAGAIRHGIARALVALDEENRTIMRKAGLLTRDSRAVERKKYGQPGARKRFQFSKR
ncbi:MAG TPA: 30S ribosomal protein S9 [Candidatus Krumholzibacteria bacterium]|nr:30S ribosomal protein S9 [Candidatus Krumholzibacteria bacterium]HRX50194.1 30S ribosomal protein S9 [Candidatus Krumholzibacteria bacterium]